MSEIVPELENGDRLTRDEFERRYEAMPDLKKAELIEGVVYMPSPVRHRRHSRPTFTSATGWATTRRALPASRPATTAASAWTSTTSPSPTPTCFIVPECGGQARISDDDYIEGAPELVAEVASSSVSYDLGTKLQVYRRNGVREYVVWRVLDRQVDWFVLREGRYEPMALPADGIYRSTVFPGLWLDTCRASRRRSRPRARRPERRPEVTGTCRFCIPSEAVAGMTPPSRSLRW